MTEEREPFRFTFGDAFYGIIGFFFAAMEITKVASSTPLLLHGAVLGLACFLIAVVLYQIGKRYMNSAPSERKHREK